MSVKQLLGLDKFPIKEEEIMTRISEAQNQNLNEVVFTFGQQKVKIRMSPTNPQGCMQMSHEFFHNWNCYDCRN